MADTKLLPCPFCGGEAKFIHERTTYGIKLGYMKCIGCGIKTEQENCTEDFASEAWNTRKPIDDIVERLEKESDFFSGEPMGSLQKAYYCKGIDKAIDIVRKAGKEGAE